MKAISTSIKSRNADHYAKAQAAAEKAIIYALEAGKILLQAKAEGAVKGAVRPLDRLSIGNVGAVSAGSLD